MPARASFDEVLCVLGRNEVEFIVIGGVAAVLHGSPLSTDDLDVVYLATEDNLVRLAAALRELEARYFDPAGRHIEPDISKLATMDMHLLVTNMGRVDLLRKVGLDLSYTELKGRSRVFDIADFEVEVLDLEAIIETKEKANRPKDRFQLPYLKQLLAEIQRSETE